MKSDQLDYYKAYKLTKISDPYRTYLKGQNNGWWNPKISGECRLELLMETETIEEIMENFPIYDAFYEIGYRNAKPFLFVDGLKFRGLHLYSGQNCVSYHTDGTASIKGELAFLFIYESFGNEIIFIISSWNKTKVREMKIGFSRGREYGLNYNLQFNE